MEVQVYNTHDRHRPLDRALCWRDLKSKRVPPPEVFTNNMKKAAKERLQAYKVSLESTSVMLTGLQLRPRSAIPAAVLELLENRKAAARAPPGGEEADPENPYDFPQMTEEEAEQLAEQPQTTAALRPKPKGGKRRGR